MLGTHGPRGLRA